MKMNKNPHKNFNFEKSSKNLKKLLNEISIIKIKDVNSVKYKGQDIESNSVLSITNDIKTSFTKKGIKYHKDQNRDLIDIFISKVLQLGYSVGYEAHKEKTSDILNIIKKNEK